jgi:hypothetical protein
MSDIIRVNRGELEDEMLNVSDNQPGPSRIREIVDALIAATLQIPDMDILADAQKEASE